MQHRVALAALWGLLCAVVCSAQCPSTAQDPTTVTQFQLVLDTTPQAFLCPPFQLAVATQLAGTGATVNVAVTGVSGSPLQVTLQCTAQSVCEPAVTAMFDKLRAGQLQMGSYYIIYGVDYRNRIVQNPVPAFVFPMWAIGVIIGGVAALGLLILILCLVCSRGKAKRKRKPLASMPKEDSAIANSYMPLSETPAPVEDKELPFEALFSVKPDASKPDLLIVSRKDKLRIKQSEWDARTEYVWATAEKTGTRGLVPSTHVKALKK